MQKKENKKKVVPGAGERNRASALASYDVLGKAFTSLSLNFHLRKSEN